jgi:hypothetical protein
MFYASAAAGRMRTSTSWQSAGASWPRTTDPVRRWRENGCVRSERIFGRDPMLQPVAGRPTLAQACRCDRPLYLVTEDADRRCVRCGRRPPLRMPPRWRPAA